MLVRRAVVALGQRRPLAGLAFARRRATPGDTAVERTRLDLLLDEGDGRGAAVDQARRAASQGLRQVGVLDSSRYSSLHPGYYVVFSGVYSSLSQAQAAVSRARAAGYGAAYARQITT